MFINIALAKYSLEGDFAREKNNVIKKPISSVFQEVKLWYVFIYRFSWVYIAKIFLMDKNLNTKFHVARHTKFVDYN